MKYIRNFCIIAHIDHGKSTLADRLLDFTGSVTEREKKEQLLDNMDIERERGITIKSHAIQMEYEYEGQAYVLNLIDTPGHVDFSYEVSRSIAACEGALLVVDAAQSIQAQTISNLYLALENDLEIIPVLNKVDLPSASPEEVTDDIVDLLGCKAEDVIPASAKTGLGIEAILKAVIERIPPPTGTVDEPLQALVFDSVYNPFRGVETYFRVINGEIKKGQKIKFVATDKTYFADEVGTLKLTQLPRPSIKAGDVGYLITGIKDAREVKVGDTITDANNPTRNPIAGFEDVKPMVFAGIYPVDTEEFEELRSSMEKLQLNDASLVFTPESSMALGFGFRCGFLGMLHMEIIQERLEREFDMTVITTVPNVSYHAFTRKDPEIPMVVNNPSDLPDPSTIDRVEEPYIKATIITKSDFVGNVMSLCIEKRGQITNQTYLTTERVELNFDMPLAEIVFDFYDRLKTVSKGYASFDYAPIGMRVSKLVRVDILLNAQPVDALSALIHVDNAANIGKKMCEKLKELIPRQQFDIPIQAAIGAKIISRETIKALRKDVTAKCYGGDISRKRKLLEKQKKGKKRMRQVGNVEIPQQAFMAVLKLND
ncbi:translation elongation factor 4 [uncultured Muriicola sp.]|uniref:translation elongation factor 4 n=1 Tax=uncultured Muriicola sp. TaxID=1583102 RepID=UPI00263923EE|nr:translation elongation factor 4 [uncultured Muriicola sp.]